MAMREFRPAKDCSPILRLHHFSGRGSAAEKSIRENFYISVLTEINESVYS
jgi:hypothetical protein